MQTKIILALVVTTTLLVVFVVNSARKQPVLSQTNRLSRLIAQRNDFRIFVGVPLAAPKRWAVARNVGGALLNVEEFGNVPAADVHAFAVAYPSGQLVDSELCGLPLPKNSHGLFPAGQAASDSIRDEDLEIGRGYIRVSYGPSSTRPQDHGYYSTTLKNISSERIQVKRFAGYQRSGKVWNLATVTRQFYSAEEFREWYGVVSSDWIEPGQAVTDLNNYGSRPVLWAYYCQSVSGKEFVAGGVLE